MAIRLVCILSESGKYDNSRFLKHAEKLNIRIDLINGCSDLTEFTGNHPDNDLDDVVFISNGSCFPHVLKGIIDFAKNRCIVGLDPEWDISIKAELHRIDFPVILVCGGAESSRVRMNSMKYHDRISNSSLIYVNSDPVGILFSRPERIFKIFEQYIT